MHRRTIILELLYLYTKNAMSTKRLDQLKAMLKESPHDAFLLFALAKE